MEWPRRRDGICVAGSRTGERSQKKSRHIHIRHTSKQIQPLRRFRDEAGKASSDGRNRRLLGSSDDNGGFTDDGFINHDFRVGGPNICPLPARTYEIQDSHPLYLIIDALEHRMQTWIFAVLRESGIKDDHIDCVEVVGRLEADDSQDNSQLTVLITAVRTVVDDTWLNAARAIRASLLSHKETENNASAKELLDSLVVEFLEITDDHPMYMFPVLEQEEIYDQWPTIRTQILNIRDTDLLSIGCYRRGRSREAQDNPATVLILAYPQSRIDWKALRDDVVKLLDQARLPMVAVEISTASHWEEEPLVQVDLDSLHGLNRLYQTIAPRRNDDTWGTLAGFVELLGLPGTPEGQWEPFALTCYHCVEPYPEREGISHDSKVLLMEESVIWLTCA